MNDLRHIPEPEAIPSIRAATKACGFDMASDTLTGSLLRTLAASKPGGNFLELGSGTGLSTAWILEGMSPAATLTTIDNDPKLLGILTDNLKTDSRLTVICADGDEWIASQPRLPVYDFVFADTWPGKYRLLEETLAMIKPGGFYIVDDMLFRDDWPEGHAEKAETLTQTLEKHHGIHLSKLSWASGLMVAVKK